MKPPIIIPALLLFAALFFNGAPALALSVTPEWTSTQTSFGGSAGQQINNLSVSRAGDYYSFVLTLGGKPVDGTTYSVLMGNTNDLFSQYSYFLDANAASTNRTKLLMIGFSAGNVDNGAIPFGAAWDNDKKLSWMINQNDIFGGKSFWFAGQSLQTNGSTVFSETKPTMTPIPGALWLLSSGILGLVALHRKKKDAVI